jgi:hypothetical protein
MYVARPSKLWRPVIKPSEVGVQGGNVDEVR